MTAEKFTALAIDLARKIKALRDRSFNWDDGLPPKENHNRRASYDGETEQMIEQTFKKHGFDLPKGIL